MSALKSAGRHGVAALTPFSILVQQQYLKCGGQSNRLQQHGLEPERRDAVDVGLRQLLWRRRFG